MVDQSPRPRRPRALPAFHAACRIAGQIAQATASGCALVFLFYPPARVRVMSSIFFDNPLKLSEPGSVRCVAWSQGDEVPCLAVAEGCQVRVFREEGEEVADLVQSRAVLCTSLSWHPHSKVLAAGWQDGSITFTFGTGAPREDREVHRDAEVRCIAFNPKGDRCVTTDSNGMVGVWKTDQRGMLSPMCHYKKIGAHDKICWRTNSKTADGGLEPNLDTPPFFFGGEQGIIYVADDCGLCSERNKVGAPVALLEYHHQKDVVVAITYQTVVLVQFTLDLEGRVKDETKLKLSCGPNPDKLQGIWVGSGLLATASHESIVRLWNLDDNESYILSLQGVDERNSLAGDKVTAIDFNQRKRVLAAGTREGRMVQWRCSVLSGMPKSELDWQALPVVSATDMLIEQLRWGPGESLLHVKSARSCVVLSESHLNAAVQPPYIVVQTSPKQVLLYHAERKTRSTITAGFRVRGISMGGVYVLLWSFKQVALYEIEAHGASASVHSTFKHELGPITAAVLVVQGMDRLVAIATGDKIEFCNLQGITQRGTVLFSAASEGVPRSLDVNGAFLVASTSKNVIRAWNVSRSQPKPLGAARKFEGDAEEPLGDIRSVRINSDGTRISILADQRMQEVQVAFRVPDSRVFIYDLEADNFLAYDVGRRRTPVSHAWECSDPRLFLCEVIPQSLAQPREERQSSVPPSPLAALSPESMRSPSGMSAAQPARVADSLGADAGASEEEPQHSVLTLFVAGNPSERVLQQDCIACADAEHGGVPRMPVALVVPYLYFARQIGEFGPAPRTAAAAAAGVAGAVAGIPGGPETAGTGGAAISRAVLRDFAGLEDVDAETTAALLDFSFHLACGNIDEAYKSVRGVRNFGVWESMSKMCVKTGRLDVAQKCLGQMGHARAAAALRVCEEPEPEARLAMVAVHLDMLEDAESLFRKCERYDLLNLLYQACGDWDRALDVAKTKDRVHLKPTHYALAQHLEAMEDVKGALNHYELSGTYRTESPRLLCSLGLVDDLDVYIEQSEDQQLHRWYAQYLESKAQLDSAAREYAKAKDHLSLCRVACFNKDIDSAQRICEDSMDQAACYHLARHLESEGQIKEAILYFQKAGRLGHAIRLAQESALDGDLMSLALAADPASQIQAAKHYEARGQASKAVILYQKAGVQKKALDLCFSAKLFDALRKIADDLSSSSDPEVLSKCAEFFMQHNQHEKAVHLLSMSHQYERAVELCIEHDVQINEDMAERMTPEKNSMDSSKRAEILSNMAQLCRKQGSFQLACKKFTQAGDKIKAMKSLLKSGDTEKIIFFAGTARQADIYVLAGNYLQSLDWHNDADIMKNIIQFYSKAKAYDKLAAFYDACAQVEIDEYRDYEKAGGALREARKYIVKASSGDENDVRAQALAKRIATVDEFAGVTKLAKTDPDQLVQVCERMLRDPEVESAVRIGDVFAQLAEFYVEQQQLQEAYDTVERMRSRGIVPTPYLDRALLDTIYSSMGLPPPDAGEAAPVHPGVGGELGGVDEEIGEDGDWDDS